MVYYYSLDLNYKENTDVNNYTATNTLKTLRKVKNPLVKIDTIKSTLSCARKPNMT